MGSQTDGLDTSREKIIKELFEMQKSRGQLRGMTFERYLKKFDDAKRRKSKETRADD